jgi:Mor family transcriptional regulator
MEEKDQEVISLYLKGVSVKNIKKMTECGDVYKILKRNNIQTNRRLTEELKNAVVEDYLSGVTTREIKKKYKTHELYSILKQRGIEYKQDNLKQKEKYNQVIELYLNGEPLKVIEEITGCKNIDIVLKKFNVSRNRDPKEYKKDYFEELEKRNKKIIDDYLSGKYNTNDLMEKYDMTMQNIYKILKSYGIESIHNKNHHWVINEKVKQTPNIKCKFYILEDYYGHTKIGITTKNEVRKRYRKNINVFYEIDNTLEYCYYLEVKMKKILKSYIPKNIDKTIDGWSECYNLPSDAVLEYVKSTVRETTTV